MSNNNQLGFLYQTFLTGNCTAEELDTLLVYFGTGNEDELKKLIINELTKVDEVLAATPEDLAKLQGLKHLIDQRIIQNNPIIYRSLWPRIAAIAASVLIVFSVSYLAIRRYNIQPAIAKLSPKQDFLPGNNKAILTLANGEKISLSAANNGTIARQNQTIITKTNSGLLVYQSGPKAGSAVLYNTITTPKGGEFALTLSDGTKVMLDAASSIRYPVTFNGNERRVEIQGQAYFEVAHNAKKTFRVTVRGQTIEDLGTHFNINAYDDEADMRTSLIEGSVKVKFNGQTALLKPGEQAVIGENKSIIVKSINTEEALAWKNGYFEFNKADIKSVMRQLARWYDVDIVYEGNVPNRKFSGEIDRNLKASRVLEGLSFTKVHFTIKDKKIIVEP